MPKGSRWPLALAAAVLLVGGLLIGWSGDASVTARAHRSRVVREPAAGPGERPAAPIRRWWAEFEQQSAIMLGGNELLRYHPTALRQLIEALAPVTEVIVVLGDELEQGEAAELLGPLARSGRVRLIVVPIETMWMRDYGPFLTRMDGGDVLALDTDCSLPEEGVDFPDADNEYPSMLAQALGLPCLKLPLRLQGGNFLTNGDGLFVTSQAMVNNNAADGRGRRQVHEDLTRFFGCTQWLVLDALEDEPTEHVDLYMAFLDVNIVVVGQYDPHDDPVNARILDRAAARLAKVQTSAGPLQVHRIPMPPRTDGAFRTYTNVIFANGRLIVPTYSTVEPDVQAAALALYRRLLPQWEIIEIDCEEMIPLGGALHCVSMNVPAYVSIPEMIRDLPRARPRWHDEMFLEPAQEH
jgi:agmatine/peptidylarginine deiminase